jgi:hypothetical protein
MYGKLVHRPPFGHHCHAPRPPFGEPREVGERYLGHPELTDYWIKPYLLEALKHYPRLDDECVVEGLWTFANSILLKNYKAAKRVPPTFDDPEVTHKIAFLDKDDVELGAIKFWRKVDSTFGIDIKLGNAGISIVGDNDNPSVSLVNTPVNDGPKEIVNVEYLNQALVPLNDALNALADRVEVLEDLYEDQIKPIVTDPDGNTRVVHTTIHADPSDANLPTCGAVYQYGKGISDALNSKIDSLANALNGRIDGLANGLSDLNNALNGLSSKVSSIENDVANLKNSSGGSGGSGGSDTTWNVVSQSWSQFRGEGASNGSYKNLSSSNTSLLGNISGEGTSYNVPQFTVSVAANGTYGDYKCVDIGETFTCTNTSTNVSKSYIPLRLVVTYEGTRHSDGGTEPGGTYWQDVTAQVWYKEANYTLTSQDISAINAAASAFAASRSLGYDSGNI